MVCKISVLLWYFNCLNLIFSGFAMQCTGSLHNTGHRACSDFYKQLECFTLLATFTKAQKPECMCTEA